MSWDCGCKEHEPELELTDRECRDAFEIGFARYKHFRALGRDALYDEKKSLKDTFFDNINAAGGELAASKYLKRDPILDYERRSQGDLKDFIEIRTRPETYHDLGLTQRDVCCRPFILLVGVMPIYNVVGWLAGDEVLDLWLEKPPGKRPTYWVKHKFLHDIGRLTQYVQEVQLR